MKSKRKQGFFYLFTYGTLMQGKSNNALLNGATLVGEANMSNYVCYGLPYGYPAIEPTHKDNIVRGELWKVPNFIRYDKNTRVFRHEMNCRIVSI